ncbi:MAG: hypothetical protein AAGJ91_18665, partial [Pseudomonadota bacterium]
RILITQTPRFCVVYRYQGAIAFEGAEGCGGTQSLSYVLQGGGAGGNIGRPLRGLRRCPCA